MITSNELRKKYLEFFKERHHAVIPSSSLIPENDSTTLFTGSGMQPMVPYLLGEKHPEGYRIANSQKCFRTEDIEEVGDNRHTTFFEMLGNWSLGDYFKTEQIYWIFEFATKKLGLDPKRLYITVFRGNSEFGLPRDEEAAEIWKEVFEKEGIESPVVDFAEKKGMENGRIFYYDDSKNWWSRAGAPADMPIGEPGGPDSEMFWDFGDHLKLHESSAWKDKPCHVNCDCGRFLEIGNSVFMQYVRKENGFEELPNKNIDFGGGLERMVAAVNDNPDLFQIDIFRSMHKMLEKISGIRYGKNEEQNHAFRIIFDHLRAAVFLISDGALPSNKEQGYFVRRLMRRSIRFANVLKIDDDFCGKIAQVVIDAYTEAYPNLAKKQKLILSAIEEEEKKFRSTLRMGLRIFEKRIAKKNKGDILSGSHIFDLYQTYGFPIEMTEELAGEHGIYLDKEGFMDEVKKHQILSRAGSEQKFRGGLADHSEKIVKLHTATHLLHAALRKVLGPHVEQKGSNITKDRLRFDFTHPQKITDEEKQKVEELVNSAIEMDYPVSWQEMTVKEAKEKGAIGLFEDRYGERVKVYTIGNPEKKPEADKNAPTFSKEICGGPHVERTGVIGKFQIKKEEASSRGVRRIKAVIKD